MAIAYRAGSTGGNATGTNVTVNKPTGTVDGDILLAVTYREAGAWTLPSGWAWVNTGTPEQVNNTANAWIGLAWKRASSEPANWTFQLSASTWRVVTVAAWSGCVTSGNPWDVHASYTTTGLPIVAPSITTTVANTLCVVGFASYGGSDIGAGSSGYTQRDQLGGCELWEKATAATGATGSKTFGSTAVSGDWATWHIALAPDTGGSAAIVPAMLGRRLQFAIDVWR